MKLVSTIILVTLALWASGCASLQQTASTILQPTTQPTTPAQEIAGLQKDLADATAAANLAHAFGAWSNASEWAQIQQYEKDAGDALTAASNLVNGDPKALADALNYAAQLVVDFKAKAK